MGTYIVVLPLHHPIAVAEQASTLDAISGGRFDLGVGQGYYVDEYTAFGVPHRQRPSRLEEGLTILRGLWEQPVFSFEGKRFSIPPVSLRPKPTTPRLPIWVAALADDAIDRAARFGCHLAGFFGVDPLPPPEGLADAEGLHFYGAPMIVGSPDDAIREIERSRTASSVTHQILWMQIGGLDPRLTEHSMRLFAKHVMPRFRADK